MNYFQIESGKMAPLVEELNQLLSSYHIYYQNLRSFHWNIAGENFFELHERFEKLYNDARLRIDDLAERILTVGHRPLSRLSDYLENAAIRESTMATTDKMMVKTILENHRVLIETMRRSIALANEAGDEGTVDLLGGMLRSMEKNSWMLNAWYAKRLEPSLS